MAHGALSPAEGHSEHPALGLAPLVLSVIIRTLTAKFHMLFTLKFSHPVSSPLQVLPSISLFCLWGNI